MKQTSTTRKLWLAALLVALLATLLCLSAGAETEGIYTYTVTNEEATITDCDTSAGGALTIPSTLGGYPVTSIGKYAFEDCSSLTNITIPDSVTSIGSRVFEGCSSLASITVDQNNSVYHSAGNCLIETASKTLLAGCKNSVIPTDGSVTSIGDYAFAWCEKLTSVTIPDSVTSVGIYAFAGCFSLTSATIGNRVRSIDNHAFFNCYNLTNVTIGVSVTSIGTSAFCYCRKLKSVTIPNRVTSIGTSAFEGCSGLTSMIIPDSVTSIGDNAFSECDNLMSITIGSGVTSIAPYAFTFCEKLVEVYNRSLSVGVSSSFGGVGAYALNVYTPTSGASKLATTEDGYVFYEDGDTVYLIGYTGSETELTFPNVYNDKNYSIYKIAFEDCNSLTSVTIGNGVTSIGQSAFFNCTSLTGVTIGNSVTSIGGSAFYNCTSLASVNIPDSVTSIDSSAFSHCTSLTSVTIPDSVTSIGDSAFYLCTSLTSVTIPDSVTSIGSYAFETCTSLTSVTIGNSVTSIGTDAFRDCSSLTAVYITDVENWCYISFTTAEANPLYYAKNLYLNNKPVTDLTLPECVTSIVEYAFYNCDGLTSVTIGDSVTSIGDYAFYGCSTLTSVTIGDGVTSIGSYAFDSCDSLTSVTIPDSVTSIGDWAFSSSNLTSVTILSKTVSIASPNTFVWGTTIYGYVGSTVETYATQNDYAFVALDVAPIAYQVTKGENGSFSLRAIAGLNSLDYKNFGYEITITTKDEDGNDVITTLSGTDDKAYSSIYGGDTEYSIKEHFGYEYAGLATVTGLAVDSSYTKIEIRSFVTTLDGKVRYGKSGTLLYTGTLHDDGYPYFEAVTE